MCAGSVASSLRSPRTDVFVCDTWLKYEYTSSETVHGRPSQPLANSFCHCGKDGVKPFADSQSRERTDKNKYDNLNTVQRRSLAHGAATAVEWHALGDVTCKSIHEIPTGFFVPNK